jgi:hypothetical protein
MKRTPTLSTELSMAADTPVDAPEARRPMKHQAEEELFGEDHAIPESEMFPLERSTLSETFQQHAPDVQNVLGLSRTELQARHKAHLALTREAGLDIQLAGKLYEAVTSAEITWQRGKQDEAGLAAQVQADQERLRAAGRQRFGRDWDAVLEIVREEVGKVPELDKLLSTAGIGSRPEIFIELAEHYRNRLGPGWLYEHAKRRGRA